MLCQNESERLKQAHILWRLAARHAAGDISHEEYEQNFRVLIGAYDKIIDPHPQSWGADLPRRKASARNDERKLCEA